MISNPYAELGRNFYLAILPWLTAILPWLTVFTFLLPVSLNVGGSSVSANYSFLTLLYFLAPLQSWPRLLLLAAGYAVLSYLSGALFAANATSDFHFRQFISFFLFLGTLLIAAVRLPFGFPTFARATVVASGVYSVWVAIAIIASGISITNPGMVKSILVEWVPDWPQRFITVVMLGFFLALLLARKSSRWLFVAGLCGFCVIVGQGRASYLAMLGAITLLALLYLRARDWKGLRNLIYALLLATVVVAAFAGRGIDDLLLSQERGASNASSLLLEESADILRLPAIEDFPKNIEKVIPQTNSKPSLPPAIEEFPKDAETMIEHNYAEGGEASGKIRLGIWSILLNRMIDDRMWFGSGFAGPYLFDAAMGSAHSQYVDILFRTGPLGLILYLGLWVVVVWRCFRYSVELGVAMLAWFIFGFFNETTKYSYGAFLFFSLLSFAWHGWTQAGHPAPEVKVRT